MTGPFLRPGGPALTRKAIKACSLATDSRVIDIGCGIGGSLKILEKTAFQNVIGIDCSAVLVKRAARRLKQTTVIHGNAEAIPLRTGTFDAILCECVLSVLNDRSSAMYEFARVLRNTGTLILSDVFLKKALNGERGTREETLNHLLVKDEIVELLSLAGFSLVFWEEYERALKEFAARVVLTGGSLSALLGCSNTRPGGRLLPLSYFLLIARKSADVATDRHKGGTDE